MCCCQNHIVTERGSMVWVVLKNNNECLMRLSAEGLVLVRALLSPRQEMGLASCQEGAPGEPGSASPAFHTGCLECLAALAQTPLLAKTAWSTKDDAPAHLHDLTRLVPHFHSLRVEQVFRGHQARCGLATRVAMTPAPLHDAHHLEQCHGVGLPAVRQEERQGPHASYHLRHPCGGRILGSRSTVYPE